jgi:hypothetical protein
MRKSERLRLLELQMVRMEMLLEMYSQSIHNLMDLQEMEPTSNLDAGKWYQRKPQENT